MRVRFAGFAIAALCLWALAACGSPSQVTPPASGSGGSTALPAELLLSVAPEHAKGVAEIKKEAKENDDVVVRGRIGGSVEPFTKGRAILELTDSSLLICTERPDDHCPTPWDYCCEDKDHLVAHKATIQFVDAQGMPLKIDLKGQHGLKESATVVVKGKVGPRPDPKVLVINATGVFVEPKAP